MTTEQGNKPRRGCLFYGSICAGVILIVVVVAIVLGVRLARRTINEFTDTRPVALAPVSISAEQMGRARDRLEQFQQAVRADKPSAPLALNADEINAFFDSEPQLAALKGRLHLSIEGDQMKGQLSVPMEGMGLPMFKGRYLNGTGVFTVGMREGALFIGIQSLAVKGKPLPENLMRRVREQNLAANLNQDPRLAMALERLQDVQVHDGQLWIVPKTTLK